MIKSRGDCYHKCPYCGKLIPLNALICNSRRCIHEYERTIGKVHSTKEYKHYIYWHSYDITHINLLSEYFNDMDNL
ncbi:MAG: hypothetical protein BWY74_00347 [Firmicutes bacterium ADurb.Bin419]|nr:MAG: hypothetical protein BWY74_00347 [Firmicutes bacterium ADurb.Bin419]